MLSTYTINNNSINSDLELDSDNSLDLIDPNLEDNSNNTINLEDNNTYNKEKISINNNTIKLVHNRLGHINLKAIKYLVDNTKQDFINPKDITNAKISLDNCTICIKSKLTKNINKESNIIVKGYLDLIYIDISGPTSPKTFKGHEYHITLRDAYTKIPST
jgi:hypothetical protein